MTELNKLFPKTAFKTLNGSRINRYQNNVGKRMGNFLYVHKLYANQVIPSSILYDAQNILTKYNSKFNYNTLMWDSKRNIIRFDEAPNFDSAREPHVGNYLVISLDDSFVSRSGHSDNIWHHKWLWVKDDYKGFDVDKSKDWSKRWLSKLGEPAKGTELSWQSQLRRIGL